MFEMKHKTLFVKGTRKILENYINFTLNFIKFKKILCYNEKIKFESISHLNFVSQRYNPRRTFNNS